MKLPSFRLRAGVATVIVGPQGSGKTLLAEFIAAGYPRHQVIGPQTLTSHFWLGANLGRDIQTLIVDEAPHTPEQWTVVREMLISESIVVHVKGRAPTSRRAPHLILCVTDVSFKKELPDTRFDLIEIT